MAFPRDSAYHADSDADDEFERSVVASPTQGATDSDAETSSGQPSAQHTPTTFGITGDESDLPKTIISDWTPEECAQFLSSLTLRQYCESFLANGIDGEALIALKHDELREMKVNSLGHRLAILKKVYDLKLDQDIPIQEDDFVPLSAENNPQHESATKEDILKVARSLIKLRDERLAQAEAQLARLNDEYRKLRQELLPVFKMAKEQSAPLPVPNGVPYYPMDHPDSLMSPPGTAQSMPDNKSTGLGRIPSIRRYDRSLRDKNSSPTYVPSTISESATALNPSAAANQAGKDLSNGMHHGSPSTSTLPSPTSPMPYQSLPSRVYPGSATATTPRYDGSIEEPPRQNPTPTPQLAHESSRATQANKSSHPVSYISQASTLVPSREVSASVPPHFGRSNERSSSHGPDGDAPSVEIFKSFRVALEDPCYKVLPAALRKYNISADWRNYALYIVYGDQERCVGLEEKPLALFKDLDREGKKPMFMLRKLANPVDMQQMPGSATGAPRSAGPAGSSGVTGAASSGAGIRATAASGPLAGTLPGGVL